MNRPDWDVKRVVLILLAWIAGAAVPIQSVTLSFAYAQYLRKVTLGPRVIQTAHMFAQYYVVFVYLPAIIGLVVIAAYTRRHYPDIFRRIVIGIGVGAVATISLDFFRQMGVIHKWLPADTPVLFGKTVTSSKNFAFYYPVGLFIHIMNGADFGLFYVFVWGKQKSAIAAVGWAVLWAVLVEIGMMTLPPMAPMVGAFGVNYAWPQLFLLTLAAHLAFGVTLGVLAHHFLHEEEDAGGLFRFLRGPASAPAS